MLDQVATDKKLPKDKYRKKMRDLQARLFDLQRRCWEEGRGVVVIFEGWSTAGKGKAIKKLTERLEPRAFEIHAIQAARTHETRLPWLYRFWVRLPNYGEVAIFDHSWYRRALLEYLEGSVNESQRARALEDINSFERTLADDRYAIIKFFLHIDQTEQASRLEQLEGSDVSTWRVRPADRDQNERYEDHLVAIEHMLAQTETEWAPWTIVEANDGRWARARIFETMVYRLEDELERAAPAGDGPADARSRFEPGDNDAAIEIGGEN